MRLLRHAKRVDDMNAQRALSFPGIPRAALGAMALALSMTVHAVPKPGGEGSAADRPKPAMAWASLAEQTSCEAMRPVYCRGFYGFRVYADGRYSAGYLRGKDKQIKGRIAQQELANLHRYMAHYLSAPAEVRPEQAGGRRIPGSGDTCVVEYANGSAVVVFQTGTILNGGRHIPHLYKADSVTMPLIDYLHRLLERYYPQPFPG